MLKVFQTLGRDKLCQGPSAVEHLPTEAGLCLPNLCMYVPRAPESGAATQSIDGTQYNGFNLVCIDLLAGQLAYCHNHTPAETANGDRAALPTPCQLQTDKAYGK
jgi:hypothetical protein